jgi:hypothetical protein
MIDLRAVSVSGMKWDRELLWVAAPEEHLVITYNPATSKTDKRLIYAHEVWDVCPDKLGLWMMTGGGKLGRQIIFWSPEVGKELKKIDCPDGAGAGLALYDGKIWMTHRYNRKLYCLDPESGKVNWIIRTENETFSPSAYRNELWFVEADPGPLGHWSEARQGKYFFSRFDPAREKVMERRPVSVVPCCMAFDGGRFWYAEQGKKGFASISKTDCT